MPQQIRHAMRVEEGGPESQTSDAMLVIRHVSAGVRLRRLFPTRVIVERGRVRLEARAEPPLEFAGPILVNRSWLGPLVAKTDIVLGRHPTIMRTSWSVRGWRSASKIIAACRLAEVGTTDRRSTF